jgi:hypothetical protein
VGDPFPKREPTRGSGGETSDSIGRSARARRAVDLEPNPCALVPGNAPAIGDLVDDEESIATLLADTRMLALSTLVEAGPGVGNLDADASTVRVGAQLDLLGAGMENRIADQLADEKIDVVPEVGKRAIEAA